MEMAESYRESVLGNDSPRRHSDEGDSLAPKSGGPFEAEDSLIPLLPDAVVRDRVLSTLMSSPSVPLLLQLRRISGPWNRFVTTTVEWNVWVFVRLDSQGYYQYVVARSLAYQPFSRRLDSEIAAYRFLVTKDMEEVTFRVRFSRFSTRRLPFYVFLVGCPPDVEISPEYYGL